MVDFYSQINLEPGSKIIENGWKGIYDAIEKGGSVLPPFDPFQDVSPLSVADDGDDTPGISTAVSVSSEVKDGFVNIKDFDDDEEFL